MRYQLRLKECKATSKSCWGLTIAEADKLVDLWQNIGWWPNGYSMEQDMEIFDVRNNKSMTLDEYAVIIKGLKPWDKMPAYTSVKVYTL
jgi:hypothetical protein